MNLKLLSLLGAVGVVLSCNDAAFADELIDSEGDMFAREMSLTPLSKSTIMEDINIKEELIKNGMDHNGSCTNGTCA